MSMYYVTVAADQAPIQIEATQAAMCDGNLELLVAGQVVACFAHWQWYTVGDGLPVAAEPKATEPESYDELRARATGRRPERSARVDDEAGV